MQAKKGKRIGIDFDRGTALGRARDGDGDLAGLGEAANEDEEETEDDWEKGKGSRGQKEKGKSQGTRAKFDILCNLARDSLLRIFPAIYRHRLADEPTHN